MRRTLTVTILAILLAATAVPARADMGAKFAAIRILDDITVLVDVAGGGLEPAELRSYAVNAFVRNMRGMVVNDGAVVENYPAAGYEPANVGYIIMKIMSMHTESGLNVYHLDFEFGIPPRQVYWDTATMGVAPTHLDLRKEVLEDIDEVMETFAAAFYTARGE
ncbi:hypothetical protein GKC30_04265 [Pseudodesulfovibrio sp. F-1]|uniref:DUF302 domain-containing protein n=1 Tax=Pseudodesulfovibrio alkaliphilus TaxID=2661613 RepID=A0A7K1KL85_9BACT|nr:hypothetical protein [Pseudodesulfovibrio alkaliphilus]MUM76844.1 hypothetical protein [Pseudodesulfovibrio alkaliphilus]